MGVLVETPPERRDASFYSPFCATVGDFHVGNLLASAKNSVGRQKGELTHEESRRSQVWAEHVEAAEPDY